MLVCTLDEIVQKGARETSNKEQTESGGGGVFRGFRGFRGNLGWRGRARPIRPIVAPQFPEEPKKTARLL